jgi:hypothetical protein
MEFYNKKACCAPPVYTATKRTGKELSLASADKSVDLVSLTLMADCPELDLDKGDIVYVRSDRLTTGWSTERIRAPGMPGEFVLVPVEDVVAGGPGGVLKGL